MGVVSDCVTAANLLDTAQGIAREIAGKSPLAVEAAKRSFNVTEGMALRDGYRFEQSQTVALASSEDTKEAQRAFAEKRKPDFREH
jgi:enoyl-CoA hydratase